MGLFSNQEILPASIVSLCALCFSQFSCQRSFQLGEARWYCCIRAFGNTSGGCCQILTEGLVIKLWSIDWICGKNHAVFWFSSWGHGCTPVTWFMHNIVLSSKYGCMCCFRLLFKWILQMPIGPVAFSALMLLLFRSPGHLKSCMRTMNMLFILWLCSDVLLIISEQKHVKGDSRWVPSSGYPFCITLCAFYFSSLGRASSWTCIY